MCGLVSGILSVNAADQLKYPESKCDETEDIYFGQRVRDPYRWLENDTSEITGEWIKLQNKVTDEYLSQIPFLGNLRKRMNSLADYENIGTPFKKHGKYYFFKNDGLQNQSVLYEMETPDSEPSVLLDPNKFSKDGTVALQSVDFSNDGRYIAYVVSGSGSDWNEIFVMEVATRKVLEDHIRWAKFTDAQWLGDGFFYSAYDMPEGGEEYSSINEYQKVYYHKLGTPQEQDKLEYQNLKYPLRFYNAGVSDDERYIFLFESDGNGNALYVKDTRDNNSGYHCLVSSMDYEYSPVETLGNILYLKTNANAPMYKIIAVDLDNPVTENWKTIIPEKEYVLKDAQMSSGKFILTYDIDASNYAYLYSLDGTEINEIKLPALGTVDFSCSKDDKDVFYTFSSFIFPNTVYAYNTDSDESVLYYSPKVGFDNTGYITEQLEYPGKDGTKLRMFLTYKKGIKKDGNNPVLLYGYGGFNITLNPGFSVYRIPFLENGGIYVMANLRGGGEYGERWHEAGIKMNKQNVFDDFIAAAEYLIKEKYTNPGRMAINGKSNGGLLIGAVVNQRPDLFRAAVPQVGVMDMLRYHLFTVGWNWAADYGRSDDNAEMFRYLFSYSPVHNINNTGLPYPAIMVTTADHDDRVVPAHSFKYTATLQAKETGNQPKIIRIDSNAGHGAGKPVSKMIDEQADIFGFIMYNLGMDYK